MLNLHFFLKFFKNIFLTFYILKFNLKLSNRLKLMKNKNFKEILETNLHKYIHFINLFMRQGKFLKIFNNFVVVFKELQHLFKNVNFLKTLSNAQLNGILFFQTNILSRLVLLFLPSFIFFIFENIEFRFTFKFKKLTKNKRKKFKKKYSIDYAYVAPRLRLFKLIKV